MILSILHFFLIFAEVLFFYNLLIFVHELGHFSAARWRGLVVEKFGIWFGKPLWKKRINGVEYSLGTIPAGGFVSLPQMAPMEAIEGASDLKREALPAIRPIDKIIVALAGPLFSFGLALVFAVVVWIVGRPVSETELTTVIGYVLKDSPAQAAGLQPGDRILRVDGQPVTRFIGLGKDAIMWRIVSSEGKTVPVEVERAGKTLDFEVSPQKEQRQFFQRQSLRQIGIAPSLSAIVGQVFPGGPAAEAGLRPGDTVLAVDGQKLWSFQQFADLMAAHPGPLALQVERDGAVSALTLTPRVPEGEKEPRIGIEWNSEGKTKLSHPSPLQQIGGSVESMVNTFGALFSPKSDIKAQHLSGPVAIMQRNYILFDSEHGWRLVLWFGVLININLALLNLLPIPVLDGGHILLALIEWLRGRPVSLRILETINAACSLVVIGFILYVTFFDVQDLSFPWTHKAATPAMKFSPAAPAPQPQP